MTKLRKSIAVLLSLTLFAGALTACGNGGGSGSSSSASGSGSSQSASSGSSSGSGSDSDDTFTYRFFSLNTPTTWNSHEAEVVEYVTAYTEMNMWSLILNDTADGYEWVCEMASEEPEDVTAQYAGDENWGVPAGATEGYAWRVTLNPDAKWEDGTPINADSYIYSMQQILNPEMNNYSASAYYVTLPIYNAENYYKAGQGTAYYLVADIDTYEFADYGDAPLYVSFTQPTSAFWGYSAEDYYSGYEAYYLNAAGEDLLEKYGSEDYVAVTDEVISDINEMLLNWGWEEDPYNWMYMAFYEQELAPTQWENVGFLKTGDYELTVILKTPLDDYFFKYYSNNYALVNEKVYEAGKMQTGDMIKTNYGTTKDSYISYGPYKLVEFLADKEWHVTRNENWYGWTDGKHEGQFQATDIVCSIITDSATQEQLFLQGKADSLALDANLLKTYQGSDYVVYTSNPYIYFLNINNDEELLTEREEAGVNKTILTYADFRKGISLAMNRMEFVAQQGHGKALYGYISDYYVYDVENGTRYRDSEAAQQTLKTFYGVSDLDEITGYDLDAARKCLVSGYEQALADGVVSESDVFVFDYPTWDNDTASTKEVNFMQNSLDAATKGTVLEGRIIVNMVVSEDYYGMLDSGEYDLCMSGWNAGASNPYALMEFFCTDNASPQAYFGFDAESETLDIVVGGETVTNTYYGWFEELCYGAYAIADADVRNEILAALELNLMLKYRDCPFWCSSSAGLLSQKIAYPTYEEVFEVGFGGIRFMTFNFTDAEWDQYCADNNYQLNYQ